MTWVMSGVSRVPKETRAEGEGGSGQVQHARSALSGIQIAAIELCHDAVALPAASDSARSLPVSGIFSVTEPTASSAFLPAASLRSFICQTATADLKTSSYRIESC